MNKPTRFAGFAKTPPNDDSLLEAMLRTRIANSSPPCRPSIPERRPISESIISHISAETGSPERSVSAKVSVATASNPASLASPSALSILAELTSSSCLCFIRVSVCLKRIATYQPSKLWRPRSR